MTAPLADPHSATVTEARRLKAGVDYLPVADPWTHGIHWLPLTSVIAAPNGKLFLTCESTQPGETVTTLAKPNAQIIIRRRDLPPPDRPT